MIHSPSPTDFLQLGSVRRGNKTARLPQSAVPVIHLSLSILSSLRRPLVLRELFAPLDLVHFETEPRSGSTGFALSWLRLDIFHGGLRPACDAQHLHSPVERSCAAGAVAAPSQNHREAGC